MDQYNEVCNSIVSSYILTIDENGKPIDATKFIQLVESLMYRLATRLNLAYSVCLVARYMERPTEIHLAVARSILMYLRGSAHLGILYKMIDSMMLQGWTDSDYTGDNDDR